MHTWAGCYVRIWMLILMTLILSLQHKAVHAIMHRVVYSICCLFWDSGLTATSCLHIWHMTHYTHKNSLCFSPQFLAYIKLLLLNDKMDEAAHTALTGHVYTAQFFAQKSNTFVGAQPFFFYMTTACQHHWNCQRLRTSSKVKPFDNATSFPAV